MGTVKAGGISKRVSNNGLSSSDVFIIPEKITCGSQSNGHFTEVKRDQSLNLFLGYNGARSKIDTVQANGYNTCMLPRNVQVRHV
jgi:hypothetical protein